MAAVDSTAGAELRAVTAAIRRYVDHTGYGTFVTDAMCSDMATAVLGSLMALRAAENDDEVK